MSFIYAFSGKGCAIEKMATACKFNSEDRMGTYIHQDIQLGAKEIFTLPESYLTPQPFHFENLVIVADARIDNREEIQHQLGITKTGSHSDIEFIVRAYHKYGKKCTDYLKGDFAFIIWNKATKTLFAAKDQMGIKPLYYAVVNHEIVIASTIKSILAYPEISTKLNTEKIVHDFSLVSFPTASTLFKDIFSLQPGHQLNFNQGTIQLHRYWELGKNIHPIPKTQTAIEDKFKSLFYSAVNKRLRSAGKIGSEVSGGLDSTGIAAVAQEILGKGSEFYVYSFGTWVGSGDKDDSNLVADFCKLYQLQQYWKIGNNTDFSWENYKYIYENILDDVDNNGVPTFSSCFLPHAQQKGVKVLFSGWAGDQIATNTVSGFYDVLARKKALSPLWKDIRRKHPIKKALPRYAYYLLKNINGNNFYQHNLKKNQQHLKVSPIKTALFQKYNISQQPSTRFYLKNCSDIKEYFKVNINQPGIEKRTRAHTEIGKYFGVDYRFPMLDIDLLEYIYSLPMESISYQGNNRYLFTKTIGPLLPKSITQVKKSKVSTTPFAYHFWLNHLDEILNNYNEKQNPHLSQFIDWEKLNELRARIKNNPEIAKKYLNKLTPLQNFKSLIDRYQEKITT